MNWTWKVEIWKASKNGPDTDALEEALDRLCREGVIDAWRVVAQKREDHVRAIVLP